MRILSTALSRAACSACMLGYAVSCASAIDAAKYTITYLGTLGGNYSQALAINSVGQITGNAFTVGNQDIHSYVWSPSVPNGPTGTMYDLGSIAYSFGGSINDVCQVAGWGWDAILGGDKGFLWNPTTLGGTTGNLQFLATFGGSGGFAGSINRTGQMTGSADLPGNSSRHAFIWTPTVPNGANGAMQDIGTLGGTNSRGNGINAIGQIAGDSSTTGDATTHAFLYETSMHDIGTLGGSYSDAYAINATGQIAGSSTLSTTDATVQHAYLWTPTTPNGTNGSMHDLGTLGGSTSYAQAINSGGQVVGYSYAANYFEDHAFVYSDATGMLDLNALIPQGTAWRLQHATGINDAGQIVGYGIWNYGPSAFLLTPVPEPSSLALATIAALLGMTNLPLRAIKRNQRHPSRGESKGESKGTGIKFRRPSERQVSARHAFI